MEITTSKYSNQNLKNRQIECFLEWWKENSNWKNNPQADIVLRETLGAFLSNASYVIFGVEDQINFRLPLFSAKQVQIVGKDMFEHPERYFELDGDYDEEEKDDMYSEIIRVLWVRHDKREVRLYDLLSMDAKQLEMF